jgi:hypothetical protein
MSGRQDGIPIAEAAALLDLSQEAVRKRINRGTLAGYKRDGGWYVVLAPGDLPSGRPDGRTAGRQDESAQRQDSEPLEAAYRVTPAEIEQAVSRTSAQYMGDLRTMLAEVGKVYEGQLAAKDAALAAKDEALSTKNQVISTQVETIAELRRRAEQAEADALAFSLSQDASPDYSLTNALRAALEACAVLAATDTLRDNRTPEREMLEDTRRVWGPFDTSGRGKPRITRRPE